MPEFDGRVVATHLISLRFPESGRVATINVHPGEIVKAGTTIASLDPKPVQVQLDIELADFRRIRAEFDQLTRQLPTPKTEDEKTKKEIAQAKLDSAVKSVEKYKTILDSLSLICPVDAVIISTESLVPGVNITPGSYPIVLADLDSCVFETHVPEPDFYRLVPGQSGRVFLKTGHSFDAKITYLSPISEKGNGFFAAHFALPRLDLTTFRLGTTGKVTWP